MTMVRSTGVLPLGSRAALRRYAGPGSSGLGMSAASHTILEHLLKTEGSAEGLYKEMAEKAKGEGFRTIFTMLAREEAKHTEWIKQLARDGFLGPAVKHNDEILVRPFYFPSFRCWVFKVPLESVIFHSSSGRRQEDHSDNEGYSQ